MENIIRSNNIELSVRDKGAELFSIKVNGLEYMWNKKEIWAKSSPILFPFVGALKDNKYIHNGKEYKMEGKHGFARESNFKLLEKTENKLSYILSSSEETKKIYPFDFDFIVNYEIKSDNEVEMKFIVKNKSENEMYFSVGAHPAFYMPNDYNDYYIKLSNKEDIISYKLNGVLIDNNDKLLIEKNSDKITISDKIFEIDTIILDGENINESILVDKNSERKVHVKHSGFPYVGYWRPQKSNFVCIEPWYGISDMFDTNYILKEKKGIQKLDKDAIFSASLTFKFE